MKIPILFTFIFLIIGIFATIFIKNTSMDNNRISNLIQLWACIAALISVPFVICSYIQTNNAFILSQKPHLLLIAMDNNVQDSQTQKTVHITKIHYENKSNNPFYDLSVYVEIATDTTKINLNDLFSPKMYMAVGDIRDRTIATKEELLKKGFDIDAATRANQIITLSLAYDFSFNKKKEYIKVQEYVWKNNNWSIK